MKPSIKFLASLMLSAVKTQTDRRKLQRRKIVNIIKKSDDNV